MKNKYKKSRRERLFERLEDKIKFVLETRKTRMLLDIPLENGFASEEAYLSWFIDEKKAGVDINKTLSNLIRMSLSLLEDEKISIETATLSQCIIDYLFFGKDEKYIKLKYFNIGLKRINEIDNSYVNLLKTINPKGIIMNITPDTTKDELLKFIKNNYPKIKILFSGHKPFRIKRFHRKEYYEQVFRIWNRYYKMPIKKLREITGKQSYDKSTAIAFILKRDHKIKIEPEHLRVIISRMKKRKGAL